MEGTEHINKEAHSQVDQSSGQQTGKALGTLSILLVSDIHLAFEQIQQLLKWHEEHGCKSFDYVLALGDFAELHHSNKELSIEEENQAEQDITLILSELEKFKAPIYYIPGNHDPKSMFSMEMAKRPVLTINSQNLHGAWVELRPNLGLATLGGSGKSYYQKDGQQEMSEIYFPYPYSDDRNFQKDLETLMSKVTSKQVLLMTHDGPFGSVTAIDRKTRKREAASILFGSPYLNEHIKVNQGRIIGNVHGHAHDGEPIDKVLNTYIMNPGSLRFGHFAELYLQEQPDESWSISSYTKNFLL